MSALETLKNFDEKNLPDLDTVVLGALEFFAQHTETLPVLPTCERPLVIGSEGAAAAGKMLFADTAALYANESTYARMLDTYTDIDGAVIVSASGSKHAVVIAEALKASGVQTHLLTNNSAAPAAAYLDAQNVHVFPKVREPYTYNTSTYMSMLLAHSGEDPQTILDFITAEVEPRIPDTFEEYDAFFVIIPEQFTEMHAMFGAKFDEMFAPEVSGRVFTLEQAKHAKTVVRSRKECFISIGTAQILFGEKDQRVHIPLPADAGPAAMMAIGYFVIGNIQKQHPPYFKNNIAQYVSDASEMFGHQISVIVE